MSALPPLRASRFLGWVSAAIVVIAGVGLTAAPAQAEAGATNSISGVVADPTGQPASGVRVISHRREAPQNRWVWGPSTQTGSDGSFALTGLPDGEYRIEFDATSASTNLASGWWEDGTDVWSATSITVAGGAAVPDIDQRLGLGAVIAGVVTEDDGTPARSVSVRAVDVLTARWAASTLTDETGGYRLTGVRPGDYAIEFAPLSSGGSLVGEWWDDAVSKLDATVITLSAGDERSDVDSVLSSAGSLTGVVTDTAGAPAPNTYVSAVRPRADGSADWIGSATTDASGAYTITGLAPGDVKVQFSPRDRLLGEWFDDAADQATATSVAAVAGAATTVDAELTIGASITGVVTDGAGQPVGDVDVLVHAVTDGSLGPVYSVATAADGSYAVTGLRPGSYKVQFDAAKATSLVAGEWWDNASTDQSAAVIELAASEEATGISPSLAPGAQIAGTVVNGAGTPVDGARITAQNVSGGHALADVWTTSDGTFAVRGLDAGSYRLGFSQNRDDGTELHEWWNNAPDAASADDIVVSTGLSVDGIDVILSEDDGSVLETFTASLSGRITDAAGAPIEGASVSVDGETFGDGFPADPDGTWSYDRLPAGRYTVGFSATIDGQLVTQWWNGVADRMSATPVVLANAEQRSGVDAVFGAPPLPVVDGSVPTITGVPRIGRMLRAHVGTWTEGTRFAYQWFADGAPIAGETRSSLRVRPAYVGSQLTVAVTGSLIGYQSATETSRPTGAVPKPRAWERWLYRWLF